MTIKTATGNTITVGLDSSTTYHQQADATSSDVTAGKTVILQLAGGGFGRGNGNAGNGPNGEQRHTAHGNGNAATVAPRTAG